MREWQQLRISETDLHRYFDDSPHNIGVLLGEPSRWLIDVDLDHPRAIELAGEYLPPTPAVFGRPSKRRSHWFYQATGPVETKKFRSKSLGMIVELRSTGCQTVVPPSTHTSGESIEWEDENAEPSAADPSELLAATQCLADAVKVKLGKKSSSPENPICNGPLGKTKEISLLQSAQRCLDALLKMQVEDQHDGSSRLFAAACRVIEHDLDDAEGLAVIRSYEKQRPFPRQWTDGEILERLRDAEKRARRGSAVCIANYDLIDVVNEDGEATRRIVPRTMTDIITELRRCTKDWPRRVDNILFVDDEVHGIDWFDRRTTAGLFGWLKHQFRVDWRIGTSFVTQAELFAELERTAKRYDALEVLPHEPRISGFYYKYYPLEGGDGSALRHLLDRLRPDTTIDRDLMLAALMTMFWGGPTGCRPAFVITSDWGRGTGKSKCAEILSYLAGGFVDVSAGEDIATSSKDCYRQRECPSE